MYSFSYLEPVCFSMSSSNCCFLTCIQVFQEAGQVVWYSHLFQNFPQFIVIYTVKVLHSKDLGHLLAMCPNLQNQDKNIHLISFQILKDDAVKVLHSICQQIWKIQQWPQDWKRSVFIPIPKKGSPKECSNYCTIVLISHANKVMLKILQARLQQYVKCIVQARCSSWF